MPDLYLSTTDDTTERHACKYVGCGKSFQRKEHLSRHASSHLGPRHTCMVCRKEFTRSDTLLRHLQLHNNVVKQRPFRRIRRACATCHLSKTKCDGNAPCSTCAKKDIKCIYQHLETSPDLLDPENSEGPNKFRLSSTQSPSGDNPVQSSGEDQVQSQLRQPATENLPITLESSVKKDSPLLELFSSYLKNRNKGPVDWSQLRIEKNPTEPANKFNPSISNEESFYPLPVQDGNRYHEIFFMHFHHRWPIINRSTYIESRHNEEGLSPLLHASINMIGAWLDGKSELAILIYEKLSNPILSSLYEISSRDYYHNITPPGLFNAVLLNIIFSLYYGTEKLVSRAVILRNGLVGALREIHFFDRETFLQGDKARIFFPNLFTRKQKRARLAGNLFRVDSYLSIIRGTPALLLPCDLNFTLPCTYALYNTYTLHLWEMRYSLQPEWREQLSIYGIIQDPKTSEAFPLFTEDIRFGFLALQSKLSHIGQQFKNSHTERIDMMRTLETWRLRLLQVPIQLGHLPNYSLEQNKALESYHCYDEAPAPHWQDEVIILPKASFIDALFSCYITGIHLSAPIQVLLRAAKDVLSPANTTESGEELRMCIDGRAAQIRDWTKSADARRALCFAADILSSYNKITEAERKAIDPVIYIALSTGALVLWAYCEFGLHNCEECALMAFVTTGSFEFEGLKKVELTMWSNVHQHKSLELLKQSWIEQGGGRITLEGSDLCRCFAALLIRKYDACIPSSWELKETIAPEIWKMARAETV